VEIKLRQFFNTNQKTEEKKLSSKQDYNTNRIPEYSNIRLKSNTRSHRHRRSSFWSNPVANMFDLVSGEDKIGTRLALTELRDTVKSLSNVEVNATAAIKEFFYCGQPSE